MSGYEASLGTYLAFIACVAVATVVQNLTGFALGLILLGSIALLQLVPVKDAADATMVLTLVNAAVYFRTHRARPPWRLMSPALASGVFGVALGLGALTWLSVNATEWLRLLLGLAVIASASVLVLHRRRIDQLAPPSRFAAAGFFAGVLGGLFSTSGPPMVFHMYRQPLDMETIRRGLVLVFASTAAVRLVLVAGAGAFSTRSALLSALAIPVVFGVTRGVARLRLHVPKRTVGVVAATLLVLTGLSLAASAVQALLTGCGGSCS